jgi:hypothetical protein
MEEPGLGELAWHARGPGFNPLQHRRKEKAGNEGLIIESVVPSVRV